METLLTLTLADEAATRGLGARLAGVLAALMNAHAGAAPASNPYMVQTWKG